MDDIIKKQYNEDEPVLNVNSLEHEQIRNGGILDGQNDVTSEQSQAEFKIDLAVESVLEDNNYCQDNAEISNSDNKKEAPRRKRRSGRGKKLSANDANNGGPLNHAPDKNSRTSRTKSTERNDDIPIDLFLDKVKENPVLYDTSHPENYNNRIKDKVWDSLAEELNTSGGQLKSKLRSLRDTYKKHLQINAIISGEQQKWQWAEHMEFLKPHIDLSKAANKENSNDDLISRKPNGSVRNRRSLQNLTVIDKVIDYLNEKSVREYDKLDATDHFFLSMAKTVKTFPPEQQAQAKNQIFHFVQEQELVYLAGTKA
ncbi:hypothetical protein ACJJTC_005039 [Scirpophaga incertulas]